MKKPKTKRPRRQTQAQRECSTGILEMAAQAAGFSMLGIMREDDAEAAREFKRKHPTAKGYPDLHGKDDDE